MRYLHHPSKDTRSKQCDGPCDLRVFFSFKIRVLEKLRLNTLKNNLAIAEKVHERSPKTLENSAPTVSKGVKFAVSGYTINESFDRMFYKQMPQFRTVYVHFIMIY